MTMEDFSSAIHALVGSDCPVKSIPLFFNQAIKLQENEIDHDRHLLLNLPEFIEATCRCIDKTGNSSTGPLVEKLDLYKYNLQKLIANTQEMKKVKEKFDFPKKNPELDIYDFDKNSTFYSGILFALDNQFKRSLNNTSQLEELINKNKEIYELFKSIKEKKIASIIDLNQHKMTCFGDKIKIPDLQIFARKDEDIEEDEEGEQEDEYTHEEIEEDEDEESYVEN